MQIEMFSKIILWLSIEQIKEELVGTEMVTLIGRLVYLRAVNVSRSLK